MNASKRDRRIRIERPTTVDGDYGPQSGPWVEVVTLRAEVQEVLPSKGGEEGQAGGIRVAQRRARVRTNYRTDITSDMRVVYLDRDDRLMKITTPPVEIGRKKGLEFMVADFSSQGDGA